ncbi:MAG: translation initiation factor IF-2 [Lachnospiraceae bacterium]|nr:translation initiation factor IF-2 [Lachnospiraceae bacterium]
MAKMKVHEIAKELEKQSKEIIAFLQDKGIEVKAPQSSIEDDVADMVRKSFGTEPARKADRVEEKKVPDSGEKAEKAKVEEKKSTDKENKEAKPVQNGGEAPKKKKKIIFVSNPHNSNIPGQRQGNNDRRSGQGNRPSNGNRQNQNPGRQQQETRHKIIRPLTAPSMPETTQVDFKQNARRMESERLAAKNAQAAQTKVSMENTEKQAPVQKDVNVRPAAPKEERYQRNERTSGGTGNNQGERNERNNTRRPEGANRPAASGSRNDFRGNNADRNHNRPGSNHNRSERGAQGQDNRFKRPEKPGKSFAAEAPVKDEKRRDDEKRRMGQERDKKSKKDFIYEEDETAVKNKNKAGRFIKPEKKVEEAVEEQIKVITIPESLTIKELADKMKLQPSVIIKKLFLQGQIVTVNSEISFEDAENIAIEYEIICEKEEKIDVIEELLKEDEEETEKLEKRPPVICVMGHVDHGKTSLLDAIRKTNVTDKEAGGITQHIGAYTVNVNGQSITFLDTPGHEAFTAMRMRGANSTDIAILVVAADDGVMPQTVEAINHAKAAGTEIIVAVNKIDKPGANIDRVKQEMTEYELIPVDWGGSTEFVPVSAKSGEGIEALLETILLTAEIMELKANPDRQARGLVIEAELDKGRGPVATVLVQKGTLHVGDFISAGASHGKVRAMIDDKGRRVKEALPSTPVEILGLSDVPSAGEVFIAHENDKTAKSYAETYLAQNKEKMLEETKAKMSLDDLFSQIQAGNLKELNIIVKADVQGSVEAVKQSLMKLSNEEVVVKCIHGGVGAINESDVSLASASAAIIIGFNVRPDAMAKTIAEREGVDIRLYKVIYQAIEDIEAAMKGMLDPVFEEKVIGHAEVRQIFKASAVGNIAGSYVLDGMFQRDCKVRITREGNQIYEGALASLKRFKDDVKEVKAGFECGLVFEGFDQMQELDIVEAYIMVEVPR